MVNGVEMLSSVSSRAEKRQTTTVSTAMTNYCLESLEDPTPKQMMGVQETSLSFWYDPKEDIYGSMEQ